MTVVCGTAWTGGDEITSKFLVEVLELMLAANTFLLLTHPRSPLLDS